MLSTSTLRRFGSAVGVAAALAALSLSAPAWALGSTPVTVVNPEEIAKAEGIQQPFQNTTSCTLISAPATCVATLPTPATQRLVIEFVSGFCDRSAVNFFTINISTAAGGSVTHFLVANPQLRVAASQLVRIYADPSTNIQFTVEAGDFDTGKLCQFTVSGQAVSVP
jgi:hypothetical protein